MKAGGLGSRLRLPTYGLGTWDKVLNPLRLSLLGGEIGAPASVPQASRRRCVGRALCPRGCARGPRCSGVLVLLLFLLFPHRLLRVCQLLLPTADSPLVSGQTALTFRGLAPAFGTARSR